MFLLYIIYYFSSQVHCASYFCGNSDTLPFKSCVEVRLKKKVSPKILGSTTDGDLQFLSLEERECILFFEETIGSLEEDDERTGISAGERPDSYARHPSPVDQDIIDLVHPTAHPSTQRDTLPVMVTYSASIFKTKCIMQR
uniref:Uncharacterized protein n=1 Tax=Sinocyclocheilus grahami TaxID=75366 RepID=A0A672SCH5_SINGR